MFRRRIVHRKRHLRIDAFEATLEDRLPKTGSQSRLVEGCYARSGLISDIELNECDPSIYSVDVKRRHRWIRGDWQIAGGCSRRAFRRRGPREAIRSRHSRAGKSSIIFGEPSRRPAMFGLFSRMAILPRPGLWTLDRARIIGGGSALVTSRYEGFRRSVESLWLQHLTA